MDEVDETAYYQVEEDDNLKIVKEIKRVKDCTIYHVGTRKHYQKYCFCSCDPNQMEQICEHCAKQCHSGEDHKKSEFFTGSIICQCGIKGHQVYETTSNLDKKCSYHELSLHSKKNVYYKNTEGMVICMYCNNFCLSQIQETHNGEFIKAYVKENEQLPECDCDNSSHKDLKTTFANINKFSLKTVSFEGLSPNHLLNLIFKCKISFNNIYSNFLGYLDNMKHELAKNPKYEFDSNLNITNFYWTIMNFSEISKNSKLHQYFSSNIANIFDYEFMCNIFSHSFQDIKYFWSFLNMFTICFKRISLGNAMHSFPKVNFEDYENLTPLQRLTIISKVKRDVSFMKKFIEGKINIIDVITKAVNTVLNIRFNYPEAFDFLENLFSILHKLSKFYLFTTDQKQKFSFLVSQLFLRFKDFSTNNTNQGLQTLLNKKKEIVIVLKVVKTLINISYDYNDSVIYKCLNSNFKDYNIDNSKFYYSKNEIGKSISKNCLDVLHYIRVSLTKNTSQTSIERKDTSYMLKKADEEEFEVPEQLLQKEIFESRELEKQIKQNFQDLKNKTLGSFLKPSMPENTEGPKIKMFIFKNLTNLITHATKLMSFSIGGVDSYAIGLRRCMSENIDFYMKMIKNDCPPSVKNFIIFLDHASEKIEEKYFEFFNFEIDEKELVQEFIIEIDEVFDKIKGLVNSPVSISNLALNRVVSASTIVINSPEKSNSLIEQKKKAEELFTHNEIRLLLNKSNFIYSVIKVMHFINTKDQRETELYDKILNLLLFYIEDSTDNSINLLGKEFLNILALFPSRYCLKVMDMVYRISKNLIKSKFEITSIIKCVSVLMNYFLIIKVNKIYIYFIFNYF